MYPHAVLIHLTTPEDGPIEVYFGSHETPIGLCLIAIVRNCIVHFSFLHPNVSCEEQLLRHLKKTWLKINLVYDPQKTEAIVNNLFLFQKFPASLLVKGSYFQYKTWEALLAIPFGCTVCYSEVAARIGQPKAVRAVANAVANNPIAFFIPCHRVVHKNGRLSNYRWGVDQKKRLLEWEKETLLSRKNRL